MIGVILAARDRLLIDCDTYDEFFINWQIKLINQSEKNQITPYKYGSFYFGDIFNTSRRF